MVLWMCFSTSVGQLVAWTIEAIRRGRSGVAITRGIFVVMGPSRWSSS